MSYVGASSDNIHAYFATSDAVKNGCAQAAVACLLDYWKVPPYPSKQGDDLVYAVYHAAKNEPDSPGQAFGTSPGQAEDICRYYGFTTNRWCNNRDGGKTTLVAALQKGHPVIVLLDFGALGEQWFVSCHYPVVYGCDDGSVYLTNMIPTKWSSAAKQTLSWSDFMNAWNMGFTHMGEFEYVGIDAWR